MDGVSQASCHRWMDGSVAKKYRLILGNTVENDETTAALSTRKLAIEKQFIIHKFVIYCDMIFSWIS